MANKYLPETYFVTNLTTKSKETYKLFQPIAETKWFIRANLLPINYRNLTIASAHDSMPPL